ncbi:hypothetical protein LguiB_025921 [Lonicera macranthoides]
MGKYIILSRNGKSSTFSEFQYIKRGENLLLGLYFEIWEASDRSEGKFCFARWALIDQRIISSD